MSVRRLLAATLLLCCISIVPAAAAQTATAVSAARPTTYKTVAVNGLNIFYREAGPDNAPVILLLHGFPSSSRMFDRLMPLLADRYHLIAPDYPGFGNSEAPPPDKFTYSFAAVSDIVDSFTQSLHLDRYALYVQDYGGPVGYRLAVAHPERVTALIVQNAVAHEEGLGPAWDIRKAFWKDRAVYEDKVIPGFTSLEGAKGRHLGSSPHPERYDPEAWNGKEHIWRSLDSARFNPTCSLTVIRRGVRTPIGVQSD